MESRRRREPRLVGFNTDPDPGPGPGIREVSRVSQWSVDTPLQYLDSDVQINLTLSLYSLPQHGLGRHCAD